MAIRVPELRELSPRGSSDSAQPRRQGVELHWPMALGARPVVLCQLAPELSQLSSVRQRYLNDVEAMDELARGLLSLQKGLRPSLARGMNLQGERGEVVETPWRLREAARGPALAELVREPRARAWSESRSWIEQLLELVSRIHGQGRVLRGLSLDHIYVYDGGVELLDLGLARVDALSTRTAASLVLEASPCAAPELLRTGLVDQRADLFSLGVVFYRAICGVYPYGDGPALLKETAEIEEGHFATDVPAGFVQLIRECLAPAAEGRPRDISELRAALRGETVTQSLAVAEPLDTRHCQHCGAALAEELRICLTCGHVATVFEHCSPGEGVALELVKVSERAEDLARLRGLLGALSDGPLPPLNFITDNEHIYSKHEQKHLIRLPWRMFSNLPVEQAEQMRQRFNEAGIKTRCSDRQDGDTSLSRRQIKLAGGVLVLGLLFVGILAAATQSLEAAVIGSAVAMGVVTIGTLIAAVVNQRRGQEAALRLRATPVALPSSDPLMSRMSAALRNARSSDMQALLRAAALDVQRAIDHRAAHLQEQADIDRVLAPLEALVIELERIAQRISEIDSQLARIDEGQILRKLPHLPREEAAELLQQLETLSRLEEQRSRCFNQVLTASNCIRRSVALALEIEDEGDRYQRYIEQAKAVLAVEPGQEF